MESFHDRLPWLSHEVNRWRPIRQRRRVVLEDWSVPLLPIYAMWPRRRDRSARLHAFVDWVAALYAGPR
jgi:DNA-binding transcriptional LysR family regulator